MAKKATKKKIAKKTTKKKIAKKVVVKKKATKKTTKKKTTKKKVVKKKIVKKKVTKKVAKKKVVKKKITKKKVVNKKPIKKVAKKKTTKKKITKKKVVKKKVVKKAIKKKTAKKVIKKKTVKKATTVRKKIVKKVVEKKKVTKKELTKKAPKKKIEQEQKVVSRYQNIKEEPIIIDEKTKETPKVIKEKFAEEIADLTSDYSLDKIFVAIQSLEYFANTTDECLNKGCDNLTTTSGYCRFHYIQNWNVIKNKEKILDGGILQDYIKDLVNKYNIDFITAILTDLMDEKSFYKVLKDLNIKNNEGLFHFDELPDEDDELTIEAEGTFNKRYEE